MYYMYLLIILFDGSGDINFFFNDLLLLLFSAHFFFFFALHVASTKRFTLNASIFDPRSVGNVQGTFCIIFTFLLLFSLHSN